MILHEAIDDPRPQAGPATGVRLGLVQFGPLHLIAAGAGALSLWYAASPLRDFDSLWHAEVGAQIAHLHRVTDLPSPWLGVRQPKGWVTSQWLSELGMHALRSAGGWQALVLVNVVLMLALLAGLTVMLLHGSPAAIAVPVFLLTLLGSAGAIQERPQAISLILMPWLAIACRRLQRGLGRPPLFLIAGISVLWAQLHGLWILAPIAFILVGAGQIADHPQSWRNAIVETKPALLCAAAAAAGVLNPHGLGSFLLPFRFRATTSFITEWFPTTFALSFTVSWGLLLLITFAAWARTQDAVPRSEIIWVVCWTVFGLQSFRNVTPALLLTAPLSLAALMRLSARRSRLISSPVAPQESRVLALIAVVTVAIALLSAGVKASVVNPLADVPAAKIAAWVARQPAPLRIWNSWNASGALVGLTDHKARLAIDGRADLWGDGYAQHLMNAKDLGPGWQTALNSFGPQAVVIERKSALFSALSVSGWRIEMTDGKFALLLPGPDAGKYGIAAGVPPTA